MDTVRISSAFGVAAASVVSPEQLGPALAELQGRHLELAACIRVLKAGALDHDKKLEDLGTVVTPGLNRRAEVLEGRMAEAQAHVVNTSDEVKAADIRLQAGFRQEVNNLREELQAAKHIAMTDANALKASVDVELKKVMQHFHTAEHAFGQTEDTFWATDTALKKVAGELAELRAHSLSTTTAGPGASADGSPIASMAQLVSAVETLKDELNTNLAARNGDLTNRMERGTLEAYTRINTFTAKVDASACRCGPACSSAPMRVPPRPMANQGLGGAADPFMCQATDPWMRGGAAGAGGGGGGLGGESSGPQRQAEASTLAVNVLMRV